MRFIYRYLKKDCESGFFTLIFFVRRGIIRIDNNITIKERKI